MTAIDNCLLGHVDDAQRKRVFGSLVLERFEDSFEAAFFVVLGVEVLHSLEIEQRVGHLLVVVVISDVDFSEEPVAPGLDLASNYNVGHNECACYQCEVVVVVNEQHGHSQAKIQEDRHNLKQKNPYHLAEGTRSSRHHTQYFACLTVKMVRERLLMYMPHHGLTDSSFCHS